MEQCPHDPGPQPWAWYYKRIGLCVGSLQSVPCNSPHGRSINTMVHQVTGSLKTWLQIHYCFLIKRWSPVDWVFVVPSSPPWIRQMSKHNLHWEWCLLEGNCCSYVTKAESATPTTHIRCDHTTVSSWVPTSWEKRPQMKPFPWNLDILGISPGGVFPQKLNW